MSLKAPLVILGIGNTVRMDDGAGIRVVEELEKNERLKTFDVAFKYLNTGGLDILDAIDGYQYAIIVDAASMDDQGYNPGDIIHFPDLYAFKDKYQEEISSHSMGVIPVMNFAEIGNYNLPSKIEVYGIQVKETRYFSEQLTDAVKAGVTRLTSILVKKVINFYNDLLLE
ncbi:MAG: hydrogenase maturation protease [Candidatus Heimdallarchaeota archaeon]